MPIYEYLCHEGHRTTHLCSMADKPETVTCVECNDVAVYDFLGSATRFSPEKEEKKQEDFNGMSLHDFECPQCGLRFEEIIEGGKVGGVICPDCATTAEWRPSVKIDRFSERFPYYDRGLGMVLTSKQHRLDVCKERNLIPVEGDLDVSKWASEERSKADADLKVWDDLQEKYDKHPAFADYRKARDQGRV